MRRAALPLLGALAWAAEPGPWLEVAPPRVGDAVLDPSQCSGVQEEWAVCADLPGCRESAAAAGGSGSSQALAGEAWDLASIEALAGRKMKATEGEACVDGRWSDWGPWQPCSTSCSTGVQLRHRREEVVASACGRPVVGSEHQFRTCSAGGPAASEGQWLLQPPPTRAPEPCSFQQTQEVCTLSPWSDWLPCAGCGRRDRVRRRRLELRTRAAVLEEQVAELVQRDMALTDRLDYLRAANRSLEEQNARLTAKLRQAAAKIDELALDSARASSLRAELEMDQGQLASLRRQNTELIGQVLGDEGQPATRPLAMSRNPAFRHARPAEDLPPEQGALQRQVDLLKAQNVALQTANLALESEGEALRGTAARLRLALPLACGLVSAFAVFVALAASTFLPKLPQREHKPFLDLDLESPRAQWPAARNASRASSSPAQQALLARGDSLSSFGRGGEPRPQSPASPKARGTLLASADSPKAPVPDERQDSFMDPSRDVFGDAL